MVSAKASVEVWKHSRKSVSVLRCLEIAFEQPVGVDTRSTSHDERWARNVGIAPSLFRLFGGDLIDVAPDAPNGFDAIVV